MLHSILSVIDKLKPFDRASAHCDIPCKIYDPISAQLAVLTTIRMIDLINEIKAKGELSVADQAQLSRLIAEKETHGVKVKEEVRIIWGDYIKQPQLDQFPEIHTLVHSIMLQASKVKQHINRDDALQLLVLVNRFADIFWQTKNVTTYTARCPYPPEEQVVYPKLSDA